VAGFVFRFDSAEGETGEDGELHPERSGALQGVSREFLNRLVLWASSHQAKLRASSSAGQNGHLPKWRSIPAPPLAPTSLPAQIWE
jgi:hypothetical protein